MDNNYGYLDQEVEQFAAYADTLAAARKEDKMGIGCGLGNVQKVADDEPLGAERASVESDFGGDDYDPLA